MSTKQPSVRLAYLVKPNVDWRQTQVKSIYGEEPSTNMHFSSRVSPLTPSTHSVGLDSLSRSRLMKIQGKKSDRSSSFSPLNIDENELKSNTEKPDLGASKNKPLYPLKLGRALGIIITAIGLAAIVMSIYNLIAALARTTATTTTTLPTLRWNQTGQTLAGAGVYGTAANQLSSPMGLALDSFNTLYIGDLNNSRVQKCAPNAPICITVAGQANANPGSTSNSLDQVGGIVIDSSGGVYVADIYNCRIQYWSCSEAT